ncbi:MAG: T9SS type A sorting domain-containing protein [Saprospiraceae bacterium]
MMKQIFNHKCLLLLGFLFLAITLSQAQVFKYTNQTVLKSNQQHYWQAQQAVAVAGSEFFVQLAPQDLLNKSALTLNLPTGDLILDQVTTEKNRSGRYQLKGQIAGKSGSFLLVYNPKKETFTGRILFGEDNWKLMPLGEGLHVLYEPEDFKNDCIEPTKHTNKPSTKDEQSPKKQRISPERNATKSLAGECRIRILVAYSDEVGTAAADIIGVIDLLMMQFDDINAASEVDFTVELACVEGVNINEDNAFNGDGRWIDLVQFQDDTDGSMDFIHEQRDQYDADMAILLVSQGIPNGDGTSVIGQAYDIGASSSTAFSIGIWNSSTFTFTHEFGHLLGMRHNNDGTNTPYAYGHGYINDNNVSGTNFRTVMGVGGSCTGSCQRIPQWSSNNLLNNGNPTGNTSTRDNSRVGRVAETIAAGWQSTISAKSQFREEEFVANEEEAHIYASTSFITNNKVIEFQSGSSGSFTAGSIIRLMPGFRARRGSTFSAILDDCTANALTDSGEIELRSAFESPQEKTANASLQLAIMPNPVQNNLTVQYALPNASKVILELFDISGKQIHQQVSPTTVAAGKHSTELNTALLAPGAYYLKLNTTAGSVTKKVMKVTH